MKLSVIVPAYNEETTIKRVIGKVKRAKLPRGLEKEVIVVNDASTDKTGKLLKNIKGIRVFTHKENRGKGAAVRTGIRHAAGDIILIQDADLEYDPKYYPTLIRPIIEGKTKVVYGTRLKNYPLRIVGSKKTPLITHYLGNKFLSFITNLLYGANVSDMETGYKVMRREVLENLRLRAKRFDLEPETTAKILKKGYKIYEVPIRIKPRGYEEGKKITWKDGFIALWTLVKYRFVDE